MAPFFAPPCVCVSMSVCLQHRAKTATTTITELATGIVHHESHGYPFNEIKRSKCTLDFGRFSGVNSNVQRSPRRANSQAVALPMPLLAPVITTTLSSNLTVVQSASSSTITPRHTVVYNMLYTRQYYSSPSIHQCVVANYFQVTCDVSSANTQSQRRPRVTFRQSVSPASTV